MAHRATVFRAVVWLLCAGSRLVEVGALRPTSVQAPQKNVVSRRDVGWSAAAAAAAAAACTLARSPPVGAAEKVDASKVRTTPGGAKYVVVKEGFCPTADPTGLAGSCEPRAGGYCIIDYTGFLPSGAVFDSTESKGRKPLAFRLGEKQVVAGIEEIVAQMKPGEEVQALIPAALAYGEKGVCTMPEDGSAPKECLIPPNTDLKYFLRLIRTAVAAG